MKENIRTNKIFIILVLILSCVLFPVFPQAGDASLERYMLVIGSNSGGAQRVELKYASKDAESFARVMAELGAVRQENLILLNNPDIITIQNGFESIKKIAEKRTIQTGRAELIFYYSGHSDEEGLLLSTEQYSYKELRAQIARINVDVRIAILDSCSSGAFTRAKGGVKKQPFLIDASTKMEGYAYLTSSSEDEASQESDKLEGSFFTHFLISGLRGAADNSLDKTVTLNEAYSYAYKETLARTENTQYGAQHPNYDIDLGGAGDLILTDLRQTSAGLVLDEKMEGKLFIRDKKNNLMAEINKQNGKSIEIGLEPGSYKIVYEKDGKLYKADLTIKDNQKKTVADKNFSAFSKEDSVARGDLEITEIIETEITEVIKDIEFAPAFLAIFPFLATQETKNKSTSVFSLNPMGGIQYAVSGLSISGIYDRIQTNLNGLELSILANWVTDKTNGVQISTLYNYTGDDLSGIQISSGFNVTYGVMSGIQIGAISNIAYQGVNGIQLGSGFNYIDGPLSGLQVGYGLNIANSRVTGTQISALLNYCNGPFIGMQLAAISNWNNSSTTGLQISSILNYNKSDFLGLQIAPIVNWNTGNTSGLQIAAVMNYNKENFNGLQVSAITGYNENKSTGLVIAGIGSTSEVMVGLQLAGIFNISQRLAGAQIAGIFNNADDGKGFQMALVNKAGTIKGVQLGLINITDTYDDCLPLGLINISTNGFGVNFWYNTDKNLNIALHTGGRFGYSILTAGFQIADIIQDWSFGTGYGVHIPIGPLYVNLDATINSLQHGKPAITAKQLLPVFKTCIGTSLTKDIGVYLGYSTSLYIPGLYEDASAIASGDLLTIRPFNLFNAVLNPVLIAGFQF